MEQQPPEEPLILPKSIFPQPPPFWRSFTTANLTAYNDLKSTNPSLDPSSIPASLLPLHPPPPPPPDASSYYTFHTSNPLTPTPVRPTEAELLFDDTLLSLPASTATLQLLLKRLTKSLLLKFLELLTVLGTNPAEYASEMDDLGILCRNISYAVNLYRPHQAREGVREMLERRLEEGRKEIERCERVVREGEELLRSVGEGWGRQDEEMVDMVAEKAKGDAEEIRKKREVWEMMCSVDPD